MYLSFRILHHPSPYFHFLLTIIKIIDMSPIRTLGSYGFVHSPLLSTPFLQLSQLSLPVFKMQLPPCKLTTMGDVGVLPSPWPPCTNTA